MSRWIIQRDSMNEFPEHRELNSFESSGLYECNLSRIVSELR